MTRTKDETLAIVAGCRTPFAKAGTDLQRASAADLACHVFREVLDGTGIDPRIVDEVVLGCAGPDSSEANVARVAALRAGVPQDVPAVTVMRNCASGMEALFTAEMRLRAKEGTVFLVGGAESMSNFPLMFNRPATDWFARLNRARTLPQRIKAFAGFRPGFLAPRIAVLEGLRDPISGLIMGQTAENVARRFGITREQQDEFALESHHRAASALERGRFAEEIVPIAAPPKFRKWIEHDNGIRAEQTREALAKLRPVFDKRDGDVTVGNACQLTDGAAAMLVMSQAKAEELGLEILALVRGHARAALDPAYMGLGPVHATPKALAAADVLFDDIDLFEINEAFAGQVLGCARAFESDEYCREVLGLEGAIGSIDPSCLNVNGGAIALGHPIAATGTRIVLTLAEELKERRQRYGVATLCIGGGQGQAVVLEAA
ncbi:MAG: thiolase family protein [Planctomycetes bacterium]|nr:thiolase family protein [Planctomycetota bacterium]